MAHTPSPQTIEDAPDEAASATTTRIPESRRWRRSHAVSRIVSVVACSAPAVILACAGYRHLWIHDDGFINLRIVRNWIAGYGPVFNITERVEASTSPLWIALVALAGSLGARIEDAAAYGGLALTLMGLVAGQMAALRSGRAITTEGASRLWLPAGALAYAAVAPAWDYASSGLENGLALAWLGAAFLAVTRLVDPSTAPSEGSHDGSVTTIRRIFPTGRAPWLVAAVCIGLGCLIRPELALYTAALFVPLLAAFDQRQLDQGQRGVRDRAAKAIELALASVAVPGAYQIFRMGYFGALTANTAIAKEAFRTNLTQGGHYFENFFVTYQAWFPAGALVVLAALAWRTPARMQRLGDSAPPASASLPASARWKLSTHAGVPIAAAAFLHTMYIVVLGGDYMHARMFLVPTFAATLPISIFAFPKRGIIRQSVCGVALATLVGWAAVAALTLRIGAENQDGIGDEHRWYTQAARSGPPTRLDSYPGFYFYDAAAQFLARANAQRIRRGCPPLVAGSSTSAMACGAFLDIDAQGPLSPTDHAIPADVTGVALYGAIGMVGYMLPSSFHVLDRHGLADPLASRLLVRDRGRPGHEKSLDNAFAIARFTEPRRLEDASVAAARHALACGRLTRLLQAVGEPLTVQRFFDNLLHASYRQKLRIPSDPFEAEALFCHTDMPLEISAGGSGGAPFAWRCPANTMLIGIRGTVDDHEAAISSLSPRCSDRDELDASAGAATVVEGPSFGKEKDHPFDLECPQGTVVLGLHGSSTRWLHALGAVCGPPEPHDGSQNLRTVRAGTRIGRDFEIFCPDQANPLGMAGRSGLLIDAASLLCGR